MYRDQFGEFVCVYWGLKGYSTVLPNDIKLETNAKTLFCEKSFEIT